MEKYKIGTEQLQLSAIRMDVFQYERNGYVAGTGKIVDSTLNPHYFTIPKQLLSLMRLTRTGSFYKGCTGIYLAPMRRGIVRMPFCEPRACLSPLRLPVEITTGWKGSMWAACDPAWRAIQHELWLSCITVL
jgi:hypothetical protein